jgi:hypothetical protein
MNKKEPTVNTNERLDCRKVFPSKKLTTSMSVPS